MSIVAPVATPQNHAMQRTEPLIAGVLTCQKYQTAIGFAPDSTDQPGSLCHWGGPLVAKPLSGCVTSRPSPPAAPIDAVWRGVG
jgi:hypothetical protein